MEASFESGALFHPPLATAAASDSNCVAHSFLKLFRRSLTRPFIKGRVVTMKKDCSFLVPLLGVNLLFDLQRLFALLPGCYEALIPSGGLIAKGSNV